MESNMQPEERPVFWKETLYSPRNLSDRLTRWARSNSHPCCWTSRLIEQVTVKSSNIFIQCDYTWKRGKDTYWSTRPPHPTHTYTLLSPSPPACLQGPEWRLGLKRVRVPQQVSSPGQSGRIHSQHSVNLYRASSFSSWHRFCPFPSPSTEDFWNIAGPEDALFQ